MNKNKKAQKNSTHDTQSITKTAQNNKARSEYDPHNGFEVLSKYRGAIMGFAALWILFFHEWQLMTEDKDHFPGIIEAYIKRIGFCGVDIFLFLSGIGLTFAIGKSSLGKFYYRRFKRVFLPFFIVGLIRFITEKWETPIFWKNVLCINFYAKSMYSFLWFVPAILTLYLLFPLYYKIFSKASDKLLFTAGAFEIWLILSLFFREHLRNDLYGFTNRIPIFIFGVYAGWLTKNKKTAFTKTTWFMIFTTLLTGAYFAYLANFKFWTFIVPVSNCCFPNMLIAISLPFIMAKVLDILCRLKHANIIGRIITKVLGFFGIFSLELYCVQEWLGGRIIPKMAGKDKMLINLAIFVASVAAGFVLYLAVKYFWKLIDWLLSKISQKIRLEQ